MKRLPLFEKKIEKKTAEDRCRSIANCLTSYCTAPNNNGLMNGLAGISCYFFHYFRYTGDRKYLGLGYEGLEKILKAIDNGFSQPSFAGGLAGIFWTFRYLGSMGFISNKESNALEGLDPVFRSFATRELRKGNYDYLHGAIGMWMTVDDPQGIKQVIPGPEKIEMEKIILEGLNGLKREENEGSFYWPVPESSKDREEIDMGLAHGMPSIISILGRIYKNTGNLEVMDGFIIPGMKFLLQQSVPPNPGISHFPSKTVNTSSDYPSRMAWCYGDPGVSMAILNTSINCGRHDWMSYAIKILSSSTMRRDIAETMVYDSCLCHGSSGLSLIYYILWHVTENADFREAASYWAGITLRYGDLSLKRNAFLFKSGKEELSPRFNLLEGIAGVGLSLLALMEGDLPGWERSLLLT